MGAASVPGLIWDSSLLEKPLGDVLRIAVRNRIRVTRPSPPTPGRRLSLLDMLAIVYLGYMLFEVPSNLFLKRIGSGNSFAHISITGIATMLVKLR